MTNPVTKLILALWNMTIAIVDPQTGRGTAAFVRWMNDVVQNFQMAFNQLDQQVGDITDALAKAGIAIETADAAAANANAAAAAAKAAVADAALTNSYVDPEGVLSSAIDTADTTKAMITIAAHHRIYGDGTSVAVNGATLHGLALSTTYYVVYQDAARAGETVTYQTITDSSLAGQSGAQHLVGSVTTPSSGATTPVSGGTVRPPGVGNIGKQANLA